MALTITPMYKWAWGATEFTAIVKATGDSSYPSPGGYALPASVFTFNTYAATSDFQLQAPPANPVGIWADGQGGTYGIIDSATGNLRLFVSSTGVEVANGVNVTAVNTTLVAFGH